MTNFGGQVINVSNYPFATAAYKQKSNNIFLVVEYSASNNKPTQLVNNSNLKDDHIYSTTTKIKLTNQKTSANNSILNMDLHIKNSGITGRIQIQLKQHTPKSLGILQTKIIPLPYLWWLKIIPRILRHMKIHKMHWAIWPWKKEPSLRIAVEKYAYLVITVSFQHCLFYYFL